MSMHTTAYRGQTAPCSNHSVDLKAFLPGRRDAALSFFVKGRAAAWLEAAAPVLRETER